jgi:hypothetical protein
LTVVEDVLCFVIGGAGEEVLSLGSGEEGDDDLSGGVMAVFVVG